MEISEFVFIRHSLHKTQRGLAQLLGTSLKAIHSYEQGWRTIPAAVERQILFLYWCRKVGLKHQKPCWSLVKCPLERRRQCPAWEFKAGQFCWFISGTICGGQVCDNWRQKMKICRQCPVLQSILPDLPNGEAPHDPEA